MIPQTLTAIKAILDANPTLLDEEPGYLKRLFSMIEKK